MHACWTSTRKIVGEANNNGSSELFEWLEFNPHSAFAEPHEDILILLNYKTDVWIYWSVNDSKESPADP